MRTNKFLLALLISAGSILPSAAHADGRVSGGIHFGPPPPQSVYIPAPQPAYVWAPGYWASDGFRRVWVEGHWVAARRAFAPVRHYRDGRGLHWDDPSGDVPRRNVEELRRNYREQRD